MSLDFLDLIDCHSCNNQMGVNGVSQEGGWAENLFAQLEPVFFDFVLEGAAADTQELSGFRAILIRPI